MLYLGPGSSHPDEATDGIEAGCAWTQVVRPRRRTDGRRRDTVQTVDVILYVADHGSDDEPRTLALLPLAHVPAASYTSSRCNSSYSLSYRTYIQYAHDDDDTQLQRESLRARAPIDDFTAGDIAPTPHA